MSDNDDRVTSPDEVPAGAQAAAGQAGPLAPADDPPALGLGLALDAGLLLAGAGGIVASALGVALNGLSTTSPAMATQAAMSRVSTTQNRPRGTVFLRRGAGPPGWPGPPAPGPPGRSPVAGSIR